MGTQHVCSGRLAGLVLFAVLISVYGGGCGKSVSRDGLVEPHPQWEPSPVSSDRTAGTGGEETTTIWDEPSAGTDGAGGYIGYRDPESSEVMTGAAFPDEGTMSGMRGDADDGYRGSVTPYTDGQEEEVNRDYDRYDPEMNNDGQYADPEGMTYEETSCTPPVTEQEAAYERPSDMDDGSTNTTTPGVEEGNEATVDSNSVGVTSDGDSTATTDESGMTRYESDVPNMPSDGETGESNGDFSPGPPP